MSYRPVCLIVCTNERILSEYVDLPTDTVELHEVIDYGFDELERAAAREGVATRYEPRYSDWRGGRYDLSRWVSGDCLGELVRMSDRDKSLEVLRVANAFYRALRSAAANAKESV